ncbi:MAG TPA: hypothetical protein VGL51_09175 [Solirubrobacteraceae bacterium]|jgi:hypothetical protein
MKLAAVLAAMLALGLAGCGGSSLSSRQVRSAAGRICDTAADKADSLATPKSPKEAVRFLRGGVSALTPELKALRTLRPPSDLADHYRLAIDATAAEIRELRSAIRGLKAGNDPVVETKTLQQKLAPLEARVDSAWESIDIHRCTSR